MQGVIMVFESWDVTCRRMSMCIARGRYVFESSQISCSCIQRGSLVCLLHPADNQHTLGECLGIKRSFYSSNVYQGTEETAVRASEARASEARASEVSPEVDITSFAKVRAGSS